MDVAVLSAQLRAEVAGFLREMREADAALIAARAYAKEAEATIAQIGDAGTESARKMAAAAVEIGRSLASVSGNATDARDSVRDVQISDAQIAEFKAKVDVMAGALDKLARKNAEVRAAGGGGGGLFAGILPGGARAGPAAVLTGIGLAGAMGPALIPAVAGLGLGVASGMEALIGVFGTAKLAFDGINARAFSTQKAFDRLTPVQQHLVQTLRSLDAGLIRHLQGVAQGIVIPGVTAALQSAVTPASMATLTEAVQQFSHALSDAVQVWGKLFGSTRFEQAFGSVLSADAQYIRDFVSGLANIFDAFIHVQQAAIPFTNWLDQGAVKFAAWVDAEAKAAQASGFFTNFLGQAKQGLEALGGLLGSVGHLFAALYNATDIAVAVGVIDALRTAIQDLAAFVERNQTVLRDLFTGAVQAVNDVLVAVNGLLRALGPLLDAIDAIAKAVGGWRVVFDGVLAYFTLTFAQGMIAKLVAVQVAEAGVGTAAAAAAGAGGVGKLRAALIALSGADVLGALGTLAASVGGIAASVAGLVLSLGGSQQQTKWGGTGTPILDALGKSNKALPSWLTPELRAYRSGSITGSQTEAWLRAHFQQLQKAGFNLPPALLEASITESGNAQAAMAALGITPSGTSSGFLGGVGTAATAAYGKLAAHGVNYGSAAFTSSAVALPNSNDYYVSPVKPGTTVKRQDQGQDFQGKPGDYVVAIGDAHIDFAGTNVHGFGGYVVYTLQNGPAAGQQIYVGHAMPLVKAGDYVKRGTPVAQLMSSGMGNAAGLPGWTEIGFASGLNPTDTSGAQGVGGRVFDAFLGGQPVSGSTAGAYGTPAPLTPTATRKPSVLHTVLPVAHQTAIAAAAQRYAAATAPGTSAIAQMRAAGAYIAEMVKQRQFLTAEQGKYTAGSKQELEIQRELKTVNDAINAGTTKLIASTKQWAQQSRDASALSILGLSPSGTAQTAGLGALTRQLDTIKADVAKHPALDTAAVKRQIAEFNQALSMGALDSSTRSAITTKLDQLKSQITAGMSAITAAARQKAAELAAATKQALQAQVDAARTAVTDASNVLDQQIQQLISFANTVFDQQTQNQLKKMQQSTSDTVKAMTDTMQDGIKNLQITVTSAAGNFLYGGSITQTPAEAALAALQNAHDVQQQTLTLTKAQQDLVTANATGDPQKIFDAQQAVADAQYQIQVYNLQKQATTQKDAATTQLTAAQQTYQDQKQAQIDAYQQQQSDAQTAYQHQRALQKQAMDNQLADFETLMKQYPDQAAHYLSLMVGVFKDNGILADLNSSSFVVGSTIYSGLAAGLAPINAEIDNLMNKIAQLTAAQQAAGQNPTYPNVGETSGGYYTQAQVDALNAAAVATGQPGRYTYSGGSAYYQSNVGTYGKKPIPMAAGGAGVTTGPTTFMTEGAGEPFWFGGMPGRGGNGGADIPIELHIHNIVDGRELSVVVRKHLLRLGRSNATIFTGQGVTA